MAGKVVYMLILTGGVIAREPNSSSRHGKQSQRPQSPVEFAFAMMLQRLSRPPGLAFFRFTFLCKELPKPTAESDDWEEGKKAKRKNFFLQT